MVSKVINQFLIASIPGLKRQEMHFGGRGQPIPLFSIYILERGVGQTLS